MRNDGREPQYYIEDHHDPIIDRKTWLAAQKIRKEKRYRGRPKNRRKPRLVVKGPFAGFTICDPLWNEEDLEALFPGPAPNDEYLPEPLDSDPNFITEKE